MEIKTGNALLVGLETVWNLLSPLTRIGWMGLGAPRSSGRCVLSTAGDWNWVIFKVPSNPSQSLILWLGWSLCAYPMHITHSPSINKIVNKRNISIICDEN